MNPGAELTDAYPILGQLPAGLLEAVRVDAQRFRAPAGRQLFDVEGACAQFVLVTSGTIRVVKPAANGREVLLYRVQRGENCILTVSCLLGHAAYPARGIADSDVTGYVVSRALFYRLLGESSLFREFVFRYFAERIVHLMELVEGMAFAPVEQRIADALAKQASGGRLSIQITHQKLADEIGSVREVVSRVLKQLEERGLVRLERGRIDVLDLDGVRRLAGMAF